MGDSSRLNDLIAGAREEAPGFARSVAALGSDSPAVAAHVELGVPLHPGCQR